MADDQPGHPADQNSSRARDHLANERVYLAWLRTAAGVMILGLFIAELAGRIGASFAAGALLVATGVGLLVYGAVRYNRVTREIEENRFVTGSRGRALSAVGLLLVAVVIAALPLLVAGTK